MTAQTAYSEVRRVSDNVYSRFTLVFQRICIFCKFQINSPNLHSLPKVLCCFDTVVLEYILLVEVDFDIANCIS